LISLSLTAGGGLGTGGMVSGSFRQEVNRTAEYAINNKEILFMAIILSNMPGRPCILLLKQMNCFNGCMNCLKRAIKKEPDSSGQLTAQLFWIHYWVNFTPIWFRLSCGLPAARRYRLLWLHPPPSLANRWFSFLSY